jgi:hypothetical protein
MFFVFENLTMYEIRWKNIVEQDRPPMIIWITKARIRTHLLTYSMGQSPS